MVKYEVGEIVSTVNNELAIVVDYNYANNTYLLEFSSKARNWHSENTLKPQADLIDRNEIIMRLNNFFNGSDIRVIGYLSMVKIVNECKGTK